MRPTAMLLALLTACSATALDTGNDSAAVDEVIDAPGATGEGTGDPENAVNGVRGGGLNEGSLDVFSLGYEDGVDNYIVIGWRGNVVQNGPGADFVIFENAFQVVAGNHFMDLIIVELSRDGETWVAFPHDYVANDESAYSPNPEHWIGFAGRQPVLFHEEENPTDPFDPARAGGDHFDLNDLPLDGGEAETIRDHGFRQMRLVTAPSRTNPDTGAPFVRSPVSTGADIDGVVARYLD